MALAERADLTARLTLKDELSRTAARASSNFSRSMGKMAASARKGAGTAAANITKIGLVATAAIAGAVKSGVSSLAQLEDAVTSVDGAIKTVGKGWTTTGAQIASIANDIETNVQRAFDDKEITQATETLIRYGGLAEKNLRPAMEVMTDLAAKTGDVGGASTILAKALAAPEKAAGKLTRMGIVLTKQQQKQIEALVKGGKAADAQALLLDILATKTKGAAAASAGPYRDSINILRDVWEDATRALATGFLPVLQEVATVLSDELAKPETLARIKGFGDDMAAGFRELVAGARKVDWNGVGTSLKTAADGAKGLLDAFMGMPDWVKTAVLTGWGMNKLTGGALTDIVGIGLGAIIKGAFGQFVGRGSSPANPMWVASATGGAGGMPGVIGGGGKGITGFLSRWLLPAIIGLELGTLIGNAIAPGIQQAIRERMSAPTRTSESGAPLQSRLFTGLKNHTPYDGPVNRSLRKYGRAESERDDVNWERISAAQTKTTAKVERLNTSVEKVKGAIDWSKQAIDTSRVNIVAATRTGDAAVVAAIRGIQRPIVNVRVNAAYNLTRVSYSTGTSLSTSGNWATGATRGM